MKYILLFLFLNLYGFNLMAQDSNYVVFGSTDCTWITTKNNRFSGTDEWNIDFVYKKTPWLISIGEFGDFWPTLNINKYPNEVNCAFLPLGKRVYFRFVQVQPRDPFILYNFALNVGDTIHYNYRIVNDYPVLNPHYKVVKSTGTITLENGEIRRTMTLITPFYEDDIWVEGIGSICGIGVLNPLVTITPANGDQYRVEYYCENNVVLYNPEDCLLCSCEINAGIDEITNKTQLLVYPNPADKEIHISLYDEIIEEIQIFNNIGQLVYKSCVGNNTETINISSFITGVYLIHCKTKKNQFSKKIVIQ